MYPARHALKYLWVVQRERESERASETDSTFALPSAVLLLKFLAMLGPGPGRNREQKLNSGLPYMWRKPSSVNHYCCLPGCTLQKAVIRSRGKIETQAFWYKMLAFQQPFFATTPNTHTEVYLQKFQNVLYITRSLNMPVFFPVAVVTNYHQCSYSKEWQFILLQL